MTPIKENEMTELSHNAIQAFDDLDFLRTLHASGLNAPKPTPIESFLVAHPAALAFVQDPKPFPASFIKESFFAINAYKFTNETGISQHGRYRILPEDGSEHLDSAAAAAKAPNFLFDEIKEKLAEGSVKMRIAVQLDADGDVVDDSTVYWPEDRPLIEFGTVELLSVLPNDEAEQRHIIFDPIPRVDGIDPSGDPLLEPRAAVYLMSGRYRRAMGEAAASQPSYAAASE